MKRIIYLVFIASLLTACSDWTETSDKGIQKPGEKSDEYYAALREYKKSDHEIVFGWFGNWAPGDLTSAARSFKSAPDSVDMLSLWGWGGRGPLSEEEIAEIKYMQDVRGTVVVATLLLTNFPEGYTKDVEGARRYGKDLAERAVAEGFLGFDIDWEPGILGGDFEFENHDYMEALTREIAKYYGPASGTDRLLLIDGIDSGLTVDAGEKTGLRRELVQLFDYAIFQVYEIGLEKSIQDLYCKPAVAFGWRPEQLIFTVTFEKFAAAGGTSSKGYKNLAGEDVYMLKGLAEMQVRDVTVDGKTGTYRKGGIGVYHIQNDYANFPGFKFVRECIEIMNPAGGQSRPAGEVKEK